jgi:predicted Zn-dependent protease
LAIRMSPGLYKARTLLGAALLRVGRPTEAITTLRKSLEQSPGQINAHYHLADALYAVGQTDQARAELDFVLANRPDHERAMRLLNRINANTR